MLPIAILAGGLASRLGSLSINTPKCLIEINGKPFIEWQLKLLKAAGYKDFVFCISHKSDQIEKYLGNGSRYGLNFNYSLDGEKQLGTGGAIKKALPILGQNFAVIYGDSYLPIKFTDVEAAFINSSASGLMTIFRNNNHLDTSNVEFSDNKIVEYNKNNKNLRMHHIDYGLTYFREEAFRTYYNIEVFDLSNLCTHLSTTKKLDGFEVFNRFFEVGSIQGINDLTNHLKGN
jgi:MurNAc alpha-1-phosphate uridylyltransferase